MKKRFSAFLAVLFTRAGVGVMAAPPAEASQCWTWRDSGLNANRVRSLCVQSYPGENFNHRAVALCPGWKSYGAWTRPGEYSYANCGWLNASGVRVETRSS